MDLTKELEALRRTHVTCEDCWYSCPKSGECCNEYEGSECNCGADEANERIDAILAAQSTPEPMKCDCGKECAPHCDMCGQCIYEQYGTDAFLAPESVVEPVTLEWVRATYYGSDKPVVPERWICPDWNIQLKENERGECAWMNGKYELTTDSIRCDNYECGASTYIGCFESVDQAKSLAARLQAVLDSPTEPKE